MTDLCVGTLISCWAFYDNDRWNVALRTEDDDGQFMGDTKMIFLILGWFTEWTYLTDRGWLYLPYPMLPQVKIVSANMYSYDQLAESLR